MSSLERKREKHSPFTLNPDPLRKTSAEIVTEARHSLRTLRTQRPFTPRDNHRQLFGETSRTQDSRPPSTFSLYARNFEVPDSRPGSGTRLSPLEHKPRLPVAQDEDPDPISPMALPKPPSDPLELKRGARARLFRAGSLTTLPPVARPTEVRESVNSVSSPEQRELSAKGRGRRALYVEPTDRERRDKDSGGPSKPAPPRTNSVSGLRFHGGVDSSIRPGEGTGAGAGARTELGTELGNGDRPASQEAEDESVVWNVKIFPLLQELESIAAGNEWRTEEPLKEEVTGGSEDAVERLCDACDCLHGALAEQGMLGRRCRKRAGLLRALFCLIDLNSAQLNLQLAKLTLELNVSGKNLLNICKLIFKISRSESNDILFQNNSIIDSLLCVLRCEDVCVSGEAVLYCVGTLKFLSGNSALLRLLLAKDCVGVATLLIQKLHPLSQPDHTQFTIGGHIHVQLTATLRNLAALPESRPLFVSHGTLAELCLVLRHHHGDQDICTNIARVFSKLSSYSECCLVLAQTPGCYTLFIELLSKHQWKQDLVVRLLFTLGNLTSRSSEARKQLFTAEGCMSVLLGLYHTYHGRWDPPPAHTPRTPPARDTSNPCTPFLGWWESKDVLVKLVRVLANMSIHPAVGPTLAANTDLIHYLLNTLELRSMQESEELLVNVAATINNLSFYQEDSSVVRDRGLTVAKLLLKLLLSSSIDGMLEATRVFGNLSQSREVCDFIIQNNVHQFMVTLLDSKSPEVCFSACGVLTNLALNPPSRTTLTQEGAHTKLADCLRDFGPVDWQLAGLVCQTLWNLTEEGGTETVMNNQEREALLEVLTLYLNEEDALQWTSDDIRDFHRLCWELEFLPVAKRLRDRIQTQTD
nr:armadillo repeat-containing protein 2 isoform X3 [Oncorhynchus nerka]